MKRIDFSVRENDECRIVLLVTDSFRRWVGSLCEHE